MAKRTKKLKEKIPKVKPSKRTVLKDKVIKEKSKGKKETNTDSEVKTMSTYIYHKNDFVEVDIEFRADKEKVSEFKAQLEKGELVWLFFSMGVHHYKKI
jgi:hypothetical protein